MEILATVFYIVVCVLLFALAILIHEFGHFIVALKLGLRVEAFSIGFGKPIWKKTVNGVEYRISPILLGGYVSIPDVDPEGTKALEGGGEKKAKAEGEGEGQGEGEGNRVKIPAWKEILVAVAGPMMNIVLAAVIAVVLSLVPGVRFGELPAVVSDAVPDMPAAKVGIRAGDRILSVGGRAVATWTEMMTEVQICGGRETEFVSLRLVLPFALRIRIRRRCVRWQGRVRKCSSSSPTTAGSRIQTSRSSMPGRRRRGRSRRDSRSCASATAA